MEWLDEPRGDTAGAASGPGPYASKTQQLAHSVVALCADRLGAGAELPNEVREATEYDICDLLNGHEADVCEELVQIIEAESDSLDQAADRTSGRIARVVVDGVVAIIRRHGVLARLGLRRI